MCNSFYERETPNMSRALRLKCGEGAVRPVFAVPVRYGVR